MQTMSSIAKLINQLLLGAMIVTSIAVLYQVFELVSLLKERLSCLL